MFSIAQAIEIEKVTPGLLIFIFGIVQSLFFEYAPGVEAWFDKLGDKQKRLLQAGLLLAVTLSVFGLGCGNVIGGIECSQSSIIELLLVFFAALTGNQITHKVFRKEHSDPV